MNIYTDKGYLDYHKIKEISRWFTFIIGGRGIGKSHLLVDIYNDSKEPILYVARSNVALENWFSPISDFSKNDWFGREVNYKYNERKGLGLAYLNEDEVEAGTPFIYGVSLSTFNNKTGINFTQFKNVIFDEFIPQKGARPIKHEFQAYKNIMEAVYRNREFDDPVRAWFFGNSNAIESQLLIGYRLVGELYQMYKNKEEIRQVHGREMTLILPQHSPISESKNKNIFYRNLPKARKLMEIENAFADLEDDHVKHQNLSEYTLLYRSPVCCVWEHKSDWKYYITKRMKGTPTVEYANNNTALTNWQFECKYMLKPALLRGSVTFSDYEVQSDFLASWDCVTWNDIIA